ncbi:hypothetical protein [Devosia sp.]|uniref:hypothetical protein n=1 Tax=Devosia sp. TaxID=1871048 RepID=UPI003262DED2
MELVDKAFRVLISQKMQLPDPKTAVFDFKRHDQEDWPSFNGGVSVDSHGEQKGFGFEGNGCGLSFYGPNLEADVDLVHMAVDQFRRY